MFSLFASGPDQAQHPVNILQATPHVGQSGHGRSIRAVALVASSTVCHGSDTVLLDLFTTLQHDACWAEGVLTQAAIHLQSHNLRSQGDRAEPQT